MLNNSNRTFKLIIRNLHLVSFQNAFTYIVLDQSPNNPRMALLFNPILQTVRQKLPREEKKPFVQGQRDEKR